MKRNVISEKSVCFGEDRYEYVLWEQGESVVLFSRESRGGKVLWQERFIFSREEKKALADFVRILAESATAPRMIPELLEDVIEFFSETVEIG
ncbi:MAG: hypothetical protein IKD31_00750 [Clostridia bacterium]|nr:hypothetical protein [Clostridia bacterium]